MKKLIYLILISFAASVFIACGSDDDDIIYLDNRTIEGKWHMFNIQGSDSNVLVFEDNMLNAELYNRDTGKMKHSTYHGSYILTNRYIILDKHTENVNYTLTKDSLYISLYQDDFGKLIKYIKIKEGI